MLYSVDQLEGEAVILMGDDRRKITLKRSELPFTLKEGDILREEMGKWHLDPDETKRRRAEARSLLKSLFDE